MKTSQDLPVAEAEAAEDRFFAALCDGDAHWRLVTAQGTPIVETGGR